MQTHRGISRSTSSVGAARRVAHEVQALLALAAPRVAEVTEEQHKVLAEARSRLQEE
jgi:hypothetical protein